MLLVLFTADDCRKRRKKIEAHLKKGEKNTDTSAPQRAAPRVAWVSDQSNHRPFCCTLV